MNRARVFRGQIGIGPNSVYSTTMGYILDMYILLDKNELLSVRTELRSSCRHTLRLTSLSRPARARLG